MPLQHTPHSFILSIFDSAAKDQASEVDSRHCHSVTDSKAAVASSSSFVLSIDMTSAVTPPNSTQAATSQSQTLQIQADTDSARLPKACLKAMHCSRHKLVLIASPDLPFWAETALQSFARTSVLFRQLPRCLAGASKSECGRWRFRRFQEDGSSRLACCSF